METYELIELAIGFIEIGGIPALIYFYRKYNKTSEENQALKERILKYEIKEELTKP